jgi:hypothetical protein
VGFGNNPAAAGRGRDPSPALGPEAASQVPAQAKILRRFAPLAGDPPNLLATPSPRRGFHPTPPPTH